MASHEGRVKDKFRGAILGCFLGDAFGAALEGLDREEASRYLSDEFYGRYTDDTDMTLILAESIVDSRSVNPEDIAKKFALHCDLSRGYGKGTVKVIMALRAGMKWNEISGPLWEKASSGNGAAMRVSPVGLFFHDDPDELRTAALDQAIITHSHPLGQWGSVMQAASIGISLLQDPGSPPDAEEMVMRLRQILSPGPIEYLRSLDKIEGILGRGRVAETQEVAERLGNGFEAHLSVPSACYIAIAMAPDAKTAIRAAASLGGDTDTIAAMTGAIVGARVGEKGLPAEWIERLEDGPRGRSFARGLAEKLYETWKENHLAETH